MKFEGDAFISYAHLDNVELVVGRQGWVANFHRALEIRVAQLMGQSCRIWWDPKLRGNDDFTQTLIDRLHRVAAFISVVTPRYVKSEWCLREVAEFCRGAEKDCGLRVGDKGRLFKVLKTPVPPDEHPTELKSFLGYEFFKTEPDTGRVREFSEVFGPEAEREFWIKLDDLAHDVCALLESIETRQPEGVDTPSSTTMPRPSGICVYLALTTSDLKEQRETLKRDLEQHGHVVLPDQPLSMTLPDLQTAIRRDLARCRMSVHLIGKTYSLVGEGWPSSLIEIQNDLALARAAEGSFSRLVWMPRSLVVDDERQREVVEHVRMDPRGVGGTDLLETPLEDLRTLMTARLKDAVKPARMPTEALRGKAEQLYLLYDKRDQGAIAPWADFLFTQFEVIHPVFEGDEAELRDYHRENLCNCDGALIFYGAGNELWLRGKLRELQKSAGYGRTKPAPLVGICLIAPKTPDKERFRTHEAMVIPQWDGLSPDALRTFVSRLDTDENAPSGDADAKAV